MTINTENTEIFNSPSFSVKSVPLCFKIGIRQWWATARSIYWTKRCHSELLLQNWLIIDVCTEQWITALRFRWWSVRLLHEVFEPRLGRSETPVIYWQNLHLQTGFGTSSLPLLIHKFAHCGYFSWGSSWRVELHASMKLLAFNIHSTVVTLATTRCSNARQIRQQFFHGIYVMFSVMLNSNVFCW